MKRVGHILEQMLLYPNLVAAFAKAAKGKRNRPEVRAFERNLPSELHSLGLRVRNGGFSPGAWSRFTVRDPKVRVIHAAPFRERVLHHAIINVAGAVFERGAVPQSCACRRGKGNLVALALALRHTVAAPFWLKLDVAKFFDSIDHEILKRRFRRLFKDAAFLRLLDGIVDSYQTLPGKGLPIGALTSQYFANFYLDPLDRFVQVSLNCGRYVRFMDDFVLWGPDPEELRSHRGQIADWLGSELCLQLKKSGPEVGRSTDGLAFLGYRVKPHRILLGLRARRRFRRKICGMVGDHERGELGDAEFQRRVAAVIAFTEQASCLRWRRSVVMNAENGDRSNGREDFLSLSNA